MAQEIETTKAVTFKVATNDASQLYEEIAETDGATNNEGVVASLGINGQLFAFQLLNFFVVVLIVWFLILKPLTSKLEERKKMIDESLDKAKEAETNLMMSEQKFQEKIDEAKVEANKIVEKSYEEATAVGEKMKQKAMTDIELLIVQAKKNIQIEKEEALASVREETANLVVLATEKILGQALDEKIDKKVISDALASFKNI